MKLPWFGPTGEEIEAVVRELIARHGANAPGEALALCEAFRSIGASKTEKLYRLAARKSAISIARAGEAADWRRSGEAVRD